NPSERDHVPLAGLSRPSAVNSGDAKKKRSKTIVFDQLYFKCHEALIYSDEHTKQRQCTSNA
ncbi:MAG: hypothetical protein R6U85_07885, partial [Salinivirgaceae bacterium]